MITRLRAENFKSWKDTGDLRLGRLTGLFGTNSSGKTSILQLLPLLKQTAQSPDRNRVLDTGNQESAIYLGTFLDIIHGHDKDAALELSVGWTLPRNKSAEPSPAYDQLFGAQEVSFRTSIVWETERPTVGLFEYDFERQRVGMHRIAGPEERYELVHGGDRLEKIVLRGHKYLRSPIKCYGFPSNALGYFKNSSFLPSLQLAFEDVFAKVHYVGPIRPYPFRVYEWGGEKPEDAGWDGEQAIAALLASKKVRRVAEWLKDMGLIYSFRVQPVGESRTIYQCHVKITPSATEVLLPDVGFGVSQILPVLVNCAMLPDGSTLLLEQPEIHLHPFAQAALADVLIDAITNRNIQIIVESHSEHLLRRIQRRIARGVLEAEDTALYFCHLKNGTSAIEKLDVDSYGNIRNWPEDFFGDEMGELADMTLAAMERQKAEHK
ncbi:MAG TPA: DUF3696 domain-containing protein [Terriglobia bacterium]|nr:DUF3696 domain-containing protein [Terriglobia bacterium]